MATFQSRYFNGSSDGIHHLTRKSVDSISVIGTVTSYLPLIVSVALFLNFFYRFVVQYLILQDRPPKGLRLIPGPISTIPFLGRLHGINAAAPWLTMHDISKQYNKLFSLINYGQMHIWIADAKIAKELLVMRAEKYSSRPSIPAIPGSDQGGRYMALHRMDHHWRLQRRFAHTVMSAAHQNSYYDLLKPEAIRFLHGLMKNPTDHFAQTNLFTARMSALLCYGSPDAALENNRNAEEFIPQASPTTAGPATNILPFLIYLPEWLNPSKRAVRERQEREHVLWTTTLAGVKSELANGTAAEHSYARTYFERVRSTEEDANSVRDFGFDEAEAANAIGMLCTMAIFTIGGPLYCFLLVMTLHPDWQEKARKEVDRVIGSDRIVDLTDSADLPILRACIKECIRWKPPVPLGVPRLVTGDDEYDGYYIPKNSVVHVLEQAISRDPALYPDGDTYRPERWLESEWPSYQEPLTVHPRLVGFSGFGSGRRVCPGVDLTEAELLVACGSIIWGFEMHPNVDPKTGEKLWPDPSNRTSNVIGGPEPFEFDLRVRSGRGEKIEELFRLVQK